MQLKMGSIVTELTGSLGGHTVQRTKDGLSMRPKINPINKATNTQLIQRHTIHFISQRWRELTAGDRKLWLNTEMEGVKGFELYRLVNIRRRIILMQIRTRPVPQTSLLEIPSFVVLADASSQILRVTTSVAVPVNQYLIIECTPPLSPGISNPNSFFKNVRVVNGNLAVIFNINAFYIPLFGALVVGQTIFVRVTYMQANMCNKSVAKIVKATVIP
jgi:hypothetical protein